MRIGPQRCGLQTSEHRLEGKRVHADVAENIFPTEYRGEEIVDLGQQGITTELPGMPAAVEAECFRQMQPVFAGTTRQDCRPAETVDDVGDPRERIGRVAARFLKIAGELCPQMARQPPEKRAGQRNRRALGRNIFLAIFTDGKACDRACRIKEDIILAVVARSIQPCGKILVRGQREIDFKKAGVPQQL